jgi:hypothetical protein
VKYSLGIKVESVKVVLVDEYLYEPYLRTWSLKKQQREKLLKLLRLQRRQNILPSLVDSIHPIRLENNNSGKKNKPYLFYALKHL